DTSVTSNTAKENQLIHVTSDAWRVTRGEWRVKSDAAPVTRHPTPDAQLRCVLFNCHLQRHGNDLLRAPKLAPDLIAPRLWKGVGKENRGAKHGAGKQYAAGLLGAGGVDGRKKSAIGPGGDHVAAHAEPGLEIGARRATAAEAEGQRSLLASP